MAQALDLKSFGAVPGTTDNAAKINYAFQVAAAQGQPLRFGSGQWAYGDILTAVGVEIQCDPGAVLYALNPARAVLFLQGTGASVRGMTFDGVKPPGRLHTRESCRVVALDAKNFAIEGCTVRTCAGAGLRADRSSNGTIRKNTAFDTLADSIHITDGSSYIEIDQNRTERSGDDGVAVVSYRNNASPCHHIKAHDNHILNNVGGRGMSVVGGQFVDYFQNEIIGNANAAGLYFACEVAYDSYGLSHVTATRNTVRNCGNVKKGHTAVMLFSDGAFPNDDVAIGRNHIVQDVVNCGGIRVFGPNTNVKVDQNSVTATPPLLIDTAGVVVTAFTGGPVGIA